MGLFDDYAKNVLAASEIGGRGRAVEEIGRGFAESVQQITTPIVKQGLQENITGQYAISPNRLAWAKQSGIQGIDTFVKGLESAETNINDFRTALENTTDPNRKKGIKTMLEKALKDREELRSQFNKRVPSLDELKSLAVIGGKTQGRMQQFMAEYQKDIANRNFKSLDILIKEFQEKVAKQIPGYNLSDNIVFTSTMEDLRQSMTQNALQRGYAPRMLNIMLTDASKVNGNDLRDIMASSLAREISKYTDPNSKKYISNPTRQSKKVQSILSDFKNKVNAGTFQAQLAQNTLVNSLANAGVDHRDKKALAKMFHNPAGTINTLKRDISNMYRIMFKYLKDPKNPEKELNFEDMKEKAFYQVGDQLLTRQSGLGRMLPGRFREFNWGDL